MNTLRPEYIKKLRQVGITAKKADKNILSGVEEVAKLIKLNRFFFIDNADRFIEEIYNYVWDGASGKPLKLFDDVLDAVRYAIYTHTKKSGTGFGRSD